MRTALPNSIRKGWKGERDCVNDDPNITRQARERFMPIALDDDLDRAIRSELVLSSVMDFRSRLFGVYPGTINKPKNT
jgi:hypothetical protein